MVGAGSRKDNGLPAISSTNIFAALESRRRRSSKKRLERSESEAGKESSSGKTGEVPAEFWAPSALAVKSWADVEDDDDYYATTPLPPSFSSDKPVDSVDSYKEGLSQEEETDGEDDAEIEGEDDAEEEAELEATDTVSSELNSPFPTAPSTPVVREPERQLSKKELKKKELAELDKVLEELGLAKKSENDNDGSSVEAKMVEVNTDENGQQLGVGSPTAVESKISKRRKAKKEKSFKEGKEGEISTSADLEAERKVENELDVEEISAPADPQVLKKLASLRKKKSMKDGDAAAKAAAAEASARAAKLAAAKKKEKSHYNQQPVR